MLPAVLLVAIGLVTFANSFGAPFVFDDVPAIVENPFIRHFGSALAAAPQSGLAGRPLVGLSLAINYAAGGLSPAGYHAWNLAIHISASLLLFALMRRHLEDRFAFLAAALWLVHPLQTEAVDYTIQRTESMMGLLLLATVYAASRGWTVTAVVACALGMATKESMVVAPLIVLAYDAAFTRRTASRCLAARPGLYTGLAASWLVLLALNADAPRSHTAGFSTPVGVWTYLLNQAAMIATYARLVIWPHPLILDYGPVQPVRLADVWLPCTVLAILVACVALAWRSKPALAFLGTWFFLTLAPASSIVPIATEVGGERRMYLPLAAFAALAVGAVRTAGPRVRAAGLAVGLSAVCALAATSVRRNAEYARPIDLWAGVVAHRPYGRARHALGFALEQAGRRDEAIVQYRLAAPQHPLAHYNLALQLAAAGQLDDAIAEMRTRLRLEPGDVDAQGALADLLLRQARYEEAASAYDRYLQHAPGNAAAHNNLGLALVKQHRIADAVREFRTAVALAPTDSGATQNLARALKMLGG